MLANLLPNGTWHGRASVGFFPTKKHMRSRRGCWANHTPRQKNNTALRKTKFIHHTNQMIETHLNKAWKGLASFLGGWVQHLHTQISHGTWKRTPGTGVCSCIPFFLRAPCWMDIEVQHGSTTLQVLSLYLYTSRKTPSVNKEIPMYEHVTIFIMGI